MKDSQKQKAEHYRERATQLREMATTAPTDGDLKDKLLDLRANTTDWPSAPSDKFLRREARGRVGLG